jgi:hypothetical protein
MKVGDMVDVYRTDGLFGQGGMAQVYKISETGLHRHEAHGRRQRCACLEISEDLRRQR